MTVSAMPILRATETVPDLLLARAATAGAAPAYYDRYRGLWRCHSWREVADRTALLASALGWRGIGRGEAVALIGNRPALVEAGIAAQSVGAVPLILTPELSPEAIEDALAKRRARVAFVDGVCEVSVVAAMRQRLPDLELVVVDEEHRLRQQEPWLFSFAALTTSRASPPIMPIFGTVQDPAFVAIVDVESSPFAVSLSHGSAIAQARNLADLGNAQPRDRMLALVPFSWHAGPICQQIQSLLVGFPLVYPASGTEMSDLRAASPTLLAGPPHLFGRLRAEIAARITSPRLQRLFAATAGGDAPGILTRMIWIDPLKDQLGLRQVRAAVSFGGAIETESADFFATLGIAVRYVEHTAEANIPAGKIDERDRAVANQAA